MASAQNVHIRDDDYNKIKMIMLKGFYGVLKVRHTYAMKDLVDAHPRFWQDCKTEKERSCLLDKVLEKLNAELERSFGITHVLITRNELALGGARLSKRGVAFLKEWSGNSPESNNNLAEALQRMKQDAAAKAKGQAKAKAKATPSPAVPAAATMMPSRSAAPSRPATAAPWATAKAKAAPERTSATAALWATAKAKTKAKSAPERPPMTVQQSSKASASTALATPSASSSATTAAAATTTTTAAAATVATAPAAFPHHRPPPPPMSPLEATLLSMRAVDHSMETTIQEEQMIADESHDEEEEYHQHHTMESSIQEEQMIHEESDEEEELSMETNQGEEQIDEENDEETAQESWQGTVLAPHQEEVDEHHDDDDDDDIDDDESFSCESVAAPSEVPAPPVMMTTFAAVSDDAADDDNDDDDDDDDQDEASNKVQTSAVRETKNLLEDARWKLRLGDPAAAKETLKKVMELFQSGKLEVVAPVESTTAWNSERSQPTAWDSHMNFEQEIEPAELEGPSVIFNVSSNFALDDPRADVAKLIELELNACLSSAEYSPEHPKEYVAVTVGQAVLRKPVGLDGYVTVGLASAQDAARVMQHCGALLPYLDELSVLQFPFLTSVMRMCMPEPPQQS